MEITVQDKKLENARMELAITVSADDVEQAYQKEFKKLQKKVKIDGFRQGKAPLKMVETKYAEHADAEVADALAKEGFIEAVRTGSFAPINTPSYDFTTISRGAPFEFTVFFEIPPTVELGKYTDIPVEEKTCAITEKDYQKEIDSIRERHAQSELLGDDAVVENGHNVKLKVKRIDDADNADSVEFKEYTIVVGKSDDESALDSRIVGMKAGEEKEIQVKYPKQYYIKDLAGQKVTYLVQIVEINRLTLPDLDDELAKKENYDDAATLEGQIRKNVDEFVTNRTRGEARAKVLSKVVENSTFDIPATMVENEIHHIFERTQQRLGFRLDSMEQFAQLAGMGLEELKDRFREEALQSIKTTLVLTKVAEEEKMQVTEEELETLLKDLSEKHGVSLDDLKKSVETNDDHRRNLENELLIDRAMDFLYDNAKVKKLKEITVSELMQQQEQ